MMDPKKLEKQNKNNESDGSENFNINENKKKDKILKKDLTLFSSTSQNIEDFNWKTTKILQGNFFQKKNPGIIEVNNEIQLKTRNINLQKEEENNQILLDQTCSSTGSLNCTAVSSSVGTWKLIKGKVSQAMEDMKSSKNNSQMQQQQKVNLHCEDSEIENFLTIGESTNTNITPLSNIESYNVPTLKTPSKKYLKFVRRTSKSDTESEDENENNFDELLDSSSLKKSFVSLKTKAKTHMTSGAIFYSKNNNDESVTLMPENNESFLKKKTIQQNTSLKTHSNIESSKDLSNSKKKIELGLFNKSGMKNVEVESGVEMLEDMENLFQILPTKSEEINEKEIIEPTKNIKNQNTKNESVSETSASSRHRNNPIINNNGPQIKTKINNSYMKKNFLIFLLKCPRNITLIVILIIYITVIKLPISDFFRGFLTSSLLIISLNVLMKYFWELIVVKLNTISLSFLTHFVDKFTHKANIVSSDDLNSYGPQKCEFYIPDYTNMKNFEIPSIEEHKPMRSYSGWMNEIDVYDPNNFHQSMLRTVYVRLDGSVLRILNTSTRISKRATWNESEKENNNIIFSYGRTFDIKGACVKMLPYGLARKRYFSRKYPIQLIIKNEKVVKEQNIKMATPNSCFENLNSKFDSIKNEEIIKEEANCKLIENDSNTINQQNFDETDNDDNSDFLKLQKEKSDFDFGTIISKCDHKQLQDFQEPIILKEEKQNGKESKILLFARCDREKEDWYRRFHAASIGVLYDKTLTIPGFDVIAEEEVLSILKLSSCKEFLNSCSDNNLKTNLKKNVPSETKVNINNTQEPNNKHQPNLNSENESSLYKVEESPSYDGVIFSTNANRNAPDFIKFMAIYQNRWKNKQSIDETQDILNQPFNLNLSRNILWINVLIGRILYSCLNDNELLNKMKKNLQRKLSAVRLPHFMEDVSITNIHLGNTPPIIHRTSQPLLDERGTWIDADLTYEGLIHMTITTKLNLLRLKKSQHFKNTVEYGNSRRNKKNVNSESLNLKCDDSSFSPPLKDEIVNDYNNINYMQENSCADKLFSSPSDSKFSDENLNVLLSNDEKCCFNKNSAIYDSDAESTGASSSESENSMAGTSVEISESQLSCSTSGGGSRKFLRIVDRITASNIFQSATEISYIQRAMENMNAKITLRVELKGLISRVILNIPPPPSDRIWLSFRDPPKLWISAKPALGDHSFDWSIITNLIENKLYEEICKYLVYPNMIDVIVPFLGQSTYKE